MRMTGRHTRITGTVAVALAAALLTGCGSESSTTTTEPAEFGDYPDAASSIEDAAARLLPRHTDSGRTNGGSFGPCHTDDGPGLPYEDETIMDIPQFDLALDGGAADVKLTASIWILPDATTAAQYTDRLTDRWEAGDCATELDLDAGGTGHLDFDTDPIETPGWQGLQSIETGETGTEVHEPTPTVGHAVTASRGVLLTRVDWSRYAAEPGPDTERTDEWTGQAFRAVTDVLTVLGGDPDAEAPSEPDPEALSNRESGGLADAGDIDPDARESTGLDLFCRPEASFESNPDTSVPVDLPGSWARRQAFAARVVDYGGPDADTGEPFADASGPSDAKWFDQSLVIGVGAAEAAQALIAQTRETGQSGLCDRWETRDADGIDQPATDPRAGDPLEERPFTVADLDVDGWTGITTGYAARYTDTGPDAPTEESAAGTTLVAYTDTAVVMMTYQTGAGDDLDAALDRQHDTLIELLDGIP